MTRIEFRLSMPGNNSWNGKWSGDGRNYTIVRKVSDKIAALLLSGADTASWGYSFGDGWHASVRARIVKPREKPAKSDGFCGYEWMVDSILDCGAILNDEQRAARKEAAKPLPKTEAPPTELQSIPVVKDSDADRLENRSRERARAPSHGRLSVAVCRPRRRRALLRSQPPRTVAKIAAAVRAVLRPRGEGLLAMITGATMPDQTNSPDGRYWCPVPVTSLAWQECK